MIRNYLTFDKDDKRSLIAFWLSAQEAKCRCDNDTCFFTLVDTKLINSWTNVRAIWAKPLTVNSLFRCIKHNESDEVKGTKHSRHVRGQAIDISTKGMSDSEKESFIELVRDYFDYVQIYESFVHCHNL